MRETGKWKELKIELQTDRKRDGQKDRQIKIGPDSKRDSDAGVIACSRENERDREREKERW